MFSHINLPVLETLNHRVRAKAKKPVQAKCKPCEESETRGRDRLPSGPIAPEYH